MKCRTSREEIRTALVEQGRPDIVSRREAWIEGQVDLDPERRAPGFSTDHTRLQKRGYYCATRSSV